jgi:signal transduction histidine kinase
MIQSDTRTERELQEEILEPVLAGIAALAGAVVIITWMLTDIQRLERWIPGLVLAGAVLLSYALRRQGRWRASALALANGLGLACISSASVFGLLGNPLVYGIVLASGMAGLLLSSREALQTALLNSLALLAAVFAYGVLPEQRLESYLLVVGASTLALGNIALSALARRNLLTATYWALDAYIKSGRRETMLREAKAELERSLIERERLAAALHRSNEELSAAREAAESAYRLKAFLMAGLSHELRTPLNIIIGFSNTMLIYPQIYGDEPLPEAYREDVDAIRRNSTHLLELINDILDMARVEAGQLTLRRTTVRVGPLVDEAIEASQALPHAQHLVFVREGEWELPAIDADAARLRQVLLNLLANAVKFTPGGRISVGVRVEGAELLFWVRDTGIGIAENDHERIFEAFEQAGEPHDRTQGGSGLGLTICRWLVTLHGGRLWVESELGRGSTFYFTLPLGDVG